MTPASIARAVAQPRNAVALGVALMFLGDLMFALNDVMGKWLVATYSVGQVLLIRSLAALLVLAPMIWRAGVRTLFVAERPGLQVARVVIATFEVYCFYFAVIYLPLADVMTFYLAGPIYVAALSPFLLGEQVGWRRWTAIVIGFVGVVIALEPSAAMLSLPSLISLAGSLSYALLMIQSRQLRAVPDTTIVFWQMIGAALVGLVETPFTYVQPTGVDLSLLCLLGIVAMLAHILINRSLKLAPAAVVAPIQYTLLLWAIVFGYLIFGDIPRPQMLVGAAIIVAAGLFILWRQRQRGSEVVTVDPP